MERTKIIAAAIRYGDDIYTLPPPNRHHHIINHIAKLTEVNYIDTLPDDEGFIDENNNYLTRQQALVSAMINNQILDMNKIYAEELCSENLW